MPSTPPPCHDHDSSMDCLSSLARSFLQSWYNRMLKWNCFTLDSSKAQDGRCHLLNWDCRPCTQTDRNACPLYPWKIWPARACPASSGNSEEKLLHGGTVSIWHPSCQLSELDRKKGAWMFSMACAGDSKQRIAFNPIKCVMKRSWRCCQKPSQGGWMRGTCISCCSVLKMFSLVDWNDLATLTPWFPWF